MAQVTTTNPYTFDSFIAGNNAFAWQAAKCVAAQPGEELNPLFLYGGSGLGKTHLLHAVGHRARRNRSSARLALLTAEQFTQEFIGAIQNSDPAIFRNKYRQVDVLLIDDIQYLAGKDRIQEEFFHNFNALREYGRQVVITSDRPAPEIDKLEERLISRFEWGLTIHLQTPDFDTRLAILMRKRDALKLKVADDLLVWLAESIRSNVRRLEGALIRLASHQRLTGKPFKLEAAAEILPDLVGGPDAGGISITDIQSAVAQQFGLTRGDMTGMRRTKSVAFPRQVAMYLSRKLTQRSLKDVGQAFGGRGHATVLYACRTVSKRMQDDSDTRQVVHFLDRRIQQ